MSDSARAVIFGDDAGSYDRSRPGYPMQAIEHIEGLGPAATVVEVGAGTGKATVAMARPGRRLICVEPSPDMAGVLEAKDLPGVEVVVGRFEAWDGPHEPVDLIYAAQAWHWVDRDTGYAKARSLLRHGGALALMWNIHEDRYGDFADVYERHAPHLLEELDDRVRRRDSHDWLADMGAAGFADLELFTHEWSDRLTAAEVRSLYATYSDHMMLPEPVRTALLDDFERAIEERGGFVVLDYRTVVHSGRA